MTANINDDELYERAYSQARRDRELLRELTAIRRSQEPDGLTQEAVAELMGTGQANISRLENNRANVRRATLREYAVAIGAEIHYTVVPAATTQRHRSAEGGVMTNLSAPSVQERMLFPHVERLSRQNSNWEPVSFPGTSTTRVIFSGTK